MTPLRTIPRAILIVMLMSLALAATAAEKGPAPAPLPGDFEAATLSPTKTRATRMVGQGVKSAETLYGELTSEDMTHGGSSAYFDPYSFSAEAGAQLRVTMASDAFDCYLELYRPDGDAFELLLTDDDSGGDRNAMITYTAAVAGEYYLVARSYAAGATGGYTVTLAIDPPLDSAAVDTAVGSVLSMDTVHQGRIDGSDPVDQEGRSYELLSFSGAEGQYVDIHLTSDEFDTVLTLFTGTLDAPDLWVSNDDIELGSDSNSRLSGTLPSTGTFSLQVKAYSGSGSYSLALSSTPPTPEGPVVHDWEQLYPGGGDPAAAYALLVGIDDYPGTGNDLGSCIADTRVMKELLVRRFGFDPANIVVLNDAEANREHIMNAFLRHLGQAGDDGKAVFYYSGHGLQMDDNYGLAAEFDAEEDGVDEAIAIWAVDQKNSVILDDELGMLVEELHTDDVMVVLDACHSGTGTRARGEKQIRNFKDVMGDFTLPDEYFGVKDGAPASGYEAGGGSGMKELLFRGGDHVFLSAAAPDETALTGDGWPDYGGVASVFTYFLAKNLDAAGPGDTFADVAQRVREQARDYTVSTQDHVQTAQFEGSRLDAGVQALLGAR